MPAYPSLKRQYVSLPLLHARAPQLFQDQAHLRSYHALEKAFLASSSPADSLRKFGKLVSALLGQRTPLPSPQA
jgi:hypothetical protein